MGEKETSGKNQTEIILTEQRQQEEKQMEQNEQEEKEGKNKPQQIQTDLLLNGHKILQNPSAFMFGIDAVLLANFAKKEIKKNDTVVDLCTGNGIIPLLLETSSKAEKIYGVEIQEDSATLAKKSVEMNGLQNKIEIVNEDIKNLVPKNFAKHSVNCVTCNPPYMILGHGKNNPLDAKSIARHEIFCTLEDVISVAEKLIATHGKFFMIHRPFRLVEIFSLMEKYSFTPKRLQLIQPEEGKEANLVLIEARKNANERLLVEPTLNVYESSNYTLNDKIEKNSPQNQGSVGRVSNNKRRYSKEIEVIYKSFK